MIPSNGHGLLGLMAGAAKADPAPRKDQALGYVTTAAGPFVTFDEDVTETASALPVIGSYVPALGDRVFMQRINGKWVIIGPVGTGAAAAPDTWHALTLAAGWTNLGGLYLPARYIKLAGVVYVQGTVQKLSPAASETIVAAGGIPAGCRPSNNVMAGGMYSNGTGTRVYVSAAGALATTATVAPAAGATYNLGLLLSYPSEA